MCVQCIKKILISSGVLLCFRDMPSSFTGSVGKIVYSLEARLGRSMRIDSKDSTKLNFVTKADLTSDPGLMVFAALYGSDSSSMATVQPLFSTCKY